MELFSEYFKKDHILAGIDARVKLGVSLLVLSQKLSGFYGRILLKGIDSKNCK